MPYRLTRQAQTQVKWAIELRASFAGLPAAERPRKAFDKTFDMLGRFPRAGSVRADLTRRPVRLFPCDVYWVVHQMIESEGIIVVAIIDMRRSLENALGADLDSH
jgi:plasmid stabilization system protein ParE